MRRGGLLLVALLPSAFALTAWSIRNWRTFGELVPLTTNFGHHNAPDYGLDANGLFAQLRARVE